MPSENTTITASVESEATPAPAGGMSRSGPSNDGRRQRRWRKRPKRGAFCTLVLPDENGELTVIPHGVYAYLDHHSSKDEEGWMELWMLRLQYPIQWELSMLSALPEHVEVWPTMSQAVTHVERYKVDKSK